MIDIKSNKKGFTLVELCIVIALIAIVLVLMTSFIAIFETRTAQNQARHDFIDEVSVVREKIFDWIDYNEYNDYNAITGVIITIPSDTSENCILERGTVNKIKFSESEGKYKLGFEFTDQKYNSELTLEAIEEIVFTVYDPAPAADPEGEGAEEPAVTTYSGKILKCTLAGYDVFGTRFEQSFLIAVQRDEIKFIGENIPEPTND